MPLLKYLPIPFALLIPSLSVAAEDAGASTRPLDLTGHWAGYLALALFTVAYLFATTEELTTLRKSKPMVLAASLIWMVIAAVYAAGGMGELVGAAFRSALEGYAELFLFVMVSMTYLNAMEDRGVFDSLRVWLLSKNFSYRQLFWITGILAFWISSVCNNLTTALLMGAVILAMGKDCPTFVALSCINVVVAANAGGSFSPFGDITTLLVWQKGVVPFGDFYALLLPSIVNFAVPAAIMHFWIPKEKPAAVLEAPALKRGGMTIIVLFALTIVTAACFENFLKLPPVAGMLMGLTYLKFFSFYLQVTAQREADAQPVADPDDLELQQMEITAKSAPAVAGPRLGELLLTEHIITEQQLRQVLDAQERSRIKALAEAERSQPFDIFQKVAQLEWDTLLFFYGVMVGVGGLSFLGYLTVASHYLYGEIDPTVANILVGIASAFIDNGTIMLAVLTMAPDISQGQWLLVTLAAGVGGSLLAVGSAAGVGLLGQAKGAYSFVIHLKWTPAIALGYFASIGAHFLLNGRYF
ncbi:sodium:proton antiporter NhaD [Methylogaea oryzae]|uniref:Sodium:proton antiporter NhaD n=1 Tax=Methylogaea oryzae TaxID=1295382 RepID=A0A8D4VQR3_9GAMM|nr:sodium:proton antiporter NhaD [Methylogaea oryzae]BBL72350.1 sodium:proton antiporter NhaD [Methylogaea oryzae]